MNREQILQKFETLRQWGRRGERAPHKPLLVLYAIGKLLRGEERLISYTNDIEENLENLLKEFGPRRDTYNPHFPFWRLQNDGIWEVSNTDHIRQTASGDAYITDLRNYNVSGGFIETISEQLQNDSELTLDIIRSLLDAHFPLSYHEDILQAVGIPYLTQIPYSKRRDPRFRENVKRRDPRFRENILKAYEYKCAICGFDVKLRYQPIALEAAHIKWHRAGGPDTEVNGLALCSLHHKLFDRGVFRLSLDWEIMVSDDAHGSVGFQEWVMRYHMKKINFPQRPSYYPAEEFIQWHVKEVFKGDYPELKLVSSTI